MVIRMFPHNIVLDKTKIDVVGSFTEAEAHIALLLTDCISFVVTNKFDY